ncbi:MAG: cytochrome c [Desulfovibrionales bacterium]|nr:cytochrome c [Desulfovibrionales bacterium]
MNDIRKVTARVGTIGLDAYLTGQGRVFTHMPPFLGTAQERKALAEYITVVINSREPDTEYAAEITPLTEAPGSFDADSAEYVLLAWNTLGMKCVSDADRFFSLLPPGNAFGAVLIRRGEQPELVDGSEITLAYAAPADFQNPASQMDWWKFAPSLLGKELAPNVSATGLGPSGTMTYNEKTSQFEAIGIPVVPYADSGQVNPYPVFTITATDSQGQVVAETKVVAPVSTEMGCYNCHGGEWGRDGTGIAPVTARNILAVHDARSKTNLEALADKGQPVMCQSCHPDPLLGAEGNPQLLNLPAAIHGFHAHYMRDQGEEACARCHPDSPTGVTRCLRDNHASIGLGCKSCHGLLEDHAVSLLKAEQSKGKAQAEHYMRGLRPQVVASQDEIAPRTPWIQEPDCMTCHEDGRPGVESSAFNTWNDTPGQLYRNRKDEMEAVPCIACHGAPHATYPATNAYGSDRDNLQPMQYMQMAGPIGASETCAVCHTIDMDADAHH